MQASVGLADQKLSACTDDAVPRDAFSRRSCGHGVTCSASAAAEAQRSGNVPISKNPPARDLFYKAINGVPGHEYFSAKTESNE